MRGNYTYEFSPGWAQTMLSLILIIGASHPRLVGAGVESDPGLRNRCSGCLRPPGHPLLESWLLPDRRQVLAGVEHLAAIPVMMIHSRYDVSGPPRGPGSCTSSGKAAGSSSLMTLVSQGSSFSDGRSRGCAF